jgi:hypothetical protein
VSLGIHLRLGGGQLLPKLCSHSQLGHKLGRNPLLLNDDVVSLDLLRGVLLGHGLELIFEGAVIQAELVETDAKRKVLDGKLSRSLAPIDGSLCVFNSMLLDIIWCRCGTPLVYRVILRADGSLQSWHSASIMSMELLVVAELSEKFENSDIMRGRSRHHILFDYCLCAICRHLGIMVCGRQLSIDRRTVAMSGKEPLEEVDHQTLPHSLGTVRQGQHVRIESHKRSRRTIPTWTCERIVGLVCLSAMTGGLA